ncbi:hypothetical protein DL93DRAFT_59946 [Clavulina sp. PMI_390]|nr:hypothetical protein DL93DRAFT_59946 [Clavulina sp. PMI_390]
MVNKGDACIECRRQKVKCSGTKPSCSRCDRLGKDCAYALGVVRRRPPTEILEARLLQLQLQVNRLGLASIQDLSFASARLLEHVNRLGRRNSQAPVNAVFLAIYPQMGEGQLGSLASGASGQILGDDLAEGYKPVIQRTAVEHQLDLHQWRRGEELPRDLSYNLIGLFLPHRSQFQFYMDVPYFLHHLSLPPTHPDSIHPCLLNACYLGAVTIAGGRFASLQPYFLKRTRHFLQQSLMLADRITHFLWASMVLGCYFGRVKRLQESYVVVSSAARLALACGLGRDADGGMESDCQPSQPLLPPPRDEAEALDRIRLIHAILVTDRTLTGLGGFPATFECDDHWTSASVSVLRGDPKVKSEEQSSEQSLELQQTDVYLKASTLKIFGSVNKLAHSICQNGYEGHEKDFQALSAKISDCRDSIPPLSDPRGLGPLETVSNFNPHILLAHATLYGSGLILYKLRSDQDPEAKRHLIQCVRDLVNVCDKVRGQRRLRKVQTALLSMLHMMNGIRIIADELRSSAARGNLRLSADYCYCIELLMNFIEDMGSLYPGWVEAPLVLKESLTNTANALKTNAFTAKALTD